MGSNGIVSGIASGFCSMMGPFLGHSQIIALLAMTEVAVICLGWFLKPAMLEGKSGKTYTIHVSLSYIVRLAIVVGVLVSIATVPTLFGFASPCAGYIS